MSDQFEPFGTEAAFLLLGIENCLIAHRAQASLEAADSINERCALVQILLNHWARAALCWGSMQLVLPYESGSLLAQHLKAAQGKGQEPFRELEKLALEEWEKGLESGEWKPGRWRKGVPYAAEKIAEKLIPRAQELLKGKQLKRGIPMGEWTTVAGWIRRHEKTKRTPSV